MNKEELVSKIISIEWEMFQKTTNIGGRADCQDDFATFDIMRRSQWMTMSEFVLTMYLEDLKNAQQQGRNLITEKYARMMEKTSPLEYEMIKENIPRIDKQANDIIDNIIDKHIKMEQDVQSQYPLLRSRGRPMDTNADSLGSTSAITYLRSELQTYSINTLKAYKKYIDECNLNLVAKALEYTVKAYGYKSLKEAEESLRD